MPIQNGSAQIIAAIMAYLGPVFGASVLAYMLITLLIQAYEPNERTAQDLLKQIALAAAIFTLISCQRRSIIMCRAWSPA